VLERSPFVPTRRVARSILLLALRLLTGLMSRCGGSDQPTATPSVSAAATVSSSAARPTAPSSGPPTAAAITPAGRGDHLVRGRPRGVFRGKSPTGLDRRGGTARR